MNDAALFEATVPVFDHYLQRIDELLLKLSKEQPLQLLQPLAPHALSVAGHLETTLTFIPRTMLPLLGQAVPDVEIEELDRQGLIEFSSDVHALLLGIEAADFDGAATRLVRHTAGAADIEQDATMFVTLFALPNFFFHMTMAFAILRHEGVDIGKADFDGQHFHPAKFKFWI